MKEKAQGEYLSKPSHGEMTMARTSVHSLALSEQMISAMFDQDSYEEPYQDFMDEALLENKRIRENNRVAMERLKEMRGIK